MLEPLMVRALERLHLPVDLDAWLEGTKADEIEQALVSDKKRHFAHVSYIVLEGLGDPAVIKLSAAEIVALLRRA